jgi:hypothetical protein
MAIKVRYILLKFICHLFKDTQSYNIYCTIVGWLVCKELEWIWKKATVKKFPKINEKSWRKYKKIFHIQDLGKKTTAKPRREYRFL